MKFIIRLKAIHDKTGLSPYAVAKQTGVVQNTVRKYVDVDFVESNQLPVAVIELCKFYGVDWRDSSIVEVEDDPETESPLTAIA